MFELTKCEGLDFLFSVRSKYNPLIEFAKLPYKN